MVRKSKLMSLPILLALIIIGGRADAQWAQFRGPNGSGVDSSSGYPVEFSPTKNMAWKATISYGQSSPVVMGPRLYGTASEGERLITFCLDTRTGRELWRREVKRQRVQKAYKANDPASPTPAADERGVVVFFPELGLVAYDNGGKESWRCALGPFKNFYGMSASPIIAGGLVVLVCDQVSGSFVIALDRATGRLRWKTDRAGMTTGWATPMVFRPDATRADLIVLGSTRLDAYDLASGTSRWWLPLASAGSMGTPLAHGDTLMVSSLGSSEPMLPSFASVLAKYDKDKDGRLSLEEFRVDQDFGEHFGWIDESDDKVIISAEWDKARAYGLGEWGAIALRPGNARGQLAASSVRWRVQKNVPYIPAPLLYQGVYYMVKTGGIITSIDPATGRMLKQGRSSNALGEYYASPIAADDKVFLASTEGLITVLKASGEWEVLAVDDKVFLASTKGLITVLKASGEWEVLAVNEMGDEISATPALSNGRIYVRTRGEMYCFSVAR
jgi:outer membrane protein assembly factor BamB